MDADFELLIFEEEHSLDLEGNLLDLRMRTFELCFATWKSSGSSCKMALQEFRSNKLRTFLSLLGITFGIFCIISVLSTISSMQLAVNNDLKAFGNKTIYIDKWQYGGGPDYPWWKYIKRPVPKYEEIKLLKLKVPDAAHISLRHRR
jgi:ABC-type lipoprotein release transport system permease subunit